VKENEKKPRYMIYLKILNPAFNFSNTGYQTGMVSKF